MTLIKSTNWEERGLSIYTERRGRVVRTREVGGSNLGPNTSCPEIFLYSFPHFPRQILGSYVKKATNAYSTIFYFRPI
jgi:hypothetical protein